MTGRAIRAARPSDKRQVRAMLARIWDDDYIPGVFDEWVRDRRGRLWVAAHGDRVVGIAKLTLLGDHEAWLHALRVDPDHRRRGVADALLRHRLERARALGARVARLDTSEDNAAVKRLARRYGFRRVERINFFHALPVPADPPRQLSRREIDAAWRLARGSLLHGDYTARRAARSDIARAARARSGYATGPAGAPTAFAIAEPQRGSGWLRGSRLRIRLLAGSPRAMRDLAYALRGEARRMRLARAAIAPPAERWPVVRRAGYRPRWHDAMLVFEKRL